MAVTDGTRRRAGCVSCRVLRAAQISMPDCWRQWSGSVHLSGPISQRTMTISAARCRSHWAKAFQPWARRRDQAATHPAAHAAGSPRCLLFTNAGVWACTNSIHSYTTRMNIDRNWFITVTTYGSRLPGDKRGFVGYHRPQVDVKSTKRIIHNVVGTDHDADVPALRRYAADAMLGKPTLLLLDQAVALLEQFQETCDYRGWRLWATSIMANHFHVVVGVVGDPSPSDILRDLKSYGSRRLNRDWTRPANGSWWTDRGSKRKLATEESLLSAVTYTIEQEFPLVVWSHCIPELNLPGGLIHNACEQ